MKTIENWFRASDGELIFYHHFVPDDDNIKYVVQIAHGMAEHSARYIEFAEFLTARGVAVYASDHRGHGKTAKNINDIGVWNYKDAWMTIVDDLKNLNDIACKENSEKDIFILGHSMGSFLTTTFLTKYSNSVKAAVLTGVGTESKTILIAGYILSKLESIILGKKHKSKLLNSLSFGNFNKGYDSDFQWLTRNQNIVDKYNEDKYCGGIFSSSFFNNMFEGLLYNNKLINIKRINRELPILLLSGSNDPVGKFGKSIKILKSKFLLAGLKNLSIKSYKDARHEILNEINNTEVFQDIYLYINDIWSKK